MVERTLASIFSRDELMLDTLTDLASKLKAAALTIVSAVALSGCGNLIQALDDGQPWNEVLPSKAWASDKERHSWEWDFNIARLAEGKGREVAYGELARIRFKNVSGSSKTKPSKIEPSEMCEAWLYTGTTDDEKSHRKTGYFLGDPELRRALIGRKVGERFIATKPREATASFEYIPAKALMFRNSSGRGGANS